MKIVPITKQAYELFMQGSISFARMEQQGFRIDVPMLLQSKEEYATKASILKSKLEKTEEGIVLQRTEKAPNFRSNAQISKLFFKTLKYKRVKQNAVDDDVLVTLDTIFCKRLIKYRAIHKVLDYITNIIRQSTKTGDSWKLHPSFSLLHVSTFRSSSSDPNLQNIPIREEGAKKTIRRAFLPRPGHCIMEADFSGAEVSCGVCYHKDPNMLTYLEDPSTDMHRDTAGDCFICDSDLVSKEMRQGTKTFVFAEFYGDWYEPQAKKLWDTMKREKYVLTNGVSALDHLRSQGVSSKADMIEHMASVEDILWNERFMVYTKWKERTWQKYVERGYLKTKTGFYVHGLLDKKQVCNTPIQGSASHWLLWSLIQIDRWIRRHSLKSRLIGQVHDSMLLDVHPSETYMVADKIRRTMTKDIYKEYPWIITQLKVDIDITPIDGSWYTKEELK